MDLHSDSGLDFGDGDIELDLEPAAPAHGQDDDDVSINDAASVSALNTATAPGDQDDFMADHEDFIEEDYVYQDEDVNVVTEQPSTDHAAVTQTQTLAPPDEDLLDYSDDEGQQNQKTSYSSSKQEQSSAEHHEDDETSEHQDTTETVAPEIGETSEPHEQHNQDYEQANQGADVEGTDSHSQASSHHDHHSDTHHEEHGHTDGEDGGVLLQEHESYADEDENDHSDHGVSHEDHEDTQAAVDSDRQDQQSSDLQPVTVNYAGNELWLFKQHDPDDSGDWLLDDLSLAKSSMSDLFHACRTSLGDDVSNEHEIGFRFDHLHNLELYEDNTACVAVSLERLVSLYHSLHAQDGNNEPDSFYCSLLFRPRFVTLLSDIAKYADQGSGYSGLDAAVVAGETHFSNVFSGASTEHEATDWDDAEQEEAEHDDSVSADDEDAQQEVDQSDHEGQEQQTVYTEHADTQDPEQFDEQANEGASSAGVFLEQDSSHVDDLVSGENPSFTHDHADYQQQPLLSDPHNEETTESAARREQKEDDLLDYSDDEGQEDVEETKQADINEPSPSSSTVQGDDAATGQDGVDAEVAPSQDDQGNENHEVDFHGEDENDNQFNDQLLDGIDDTAQSYQNYDQAFDQEDPFQGFQTDGDANQDYAGFQYQGLDQQLQLDFMNGADFNAGDNPTTGLNDFAGTDDFLDLNTGHEWATDQEPTSNLPEDAVLVHDNTTAQDYEEDGAVEQAAAAVSSAADPETASSTEFKDVSSQGLKRSVDEAGHGVDDALDSIDAKRPRV
ncbi:hypothetical protein BKA66DRAFT_507831 [Pyrenochaeta sp. MPI-SDFR-AT-0127]|nr:hypothetical protein BKA66DRAFT_507831 [Pyrenochaeta sp. MPI-SDFR-AT-0127]